jgi:hypothetical protein
MLIKETGSKYIRQMTMEYFKTLFKPNLEKMKAKQDYIGLWQVARKDLPETRTVANDALVSIGAPAVPFLIKALRYERKELHGKAARILELIGKPAIPSLIDCLKDDNSYFRGIAAELLGRIGDPQAAEPLKRLLNDNNQKVREAAKCALGRIGDKDSLDDLIRILKDRSNNIDVREAAIMGITKIGDKKAVPSLLEVLDYYIELQRLALSALEKIGDYRVIEYYERYLDEYLCGLNLELCIDKLEADHDYINQYINLELKKRNSTRILESRNLPLLPLLSSKATIKKINEKCWEIGDENVAYKIVQIREKCDPGMPSGRDDVRYREGLTIYPLKNEFLNNLRKVVDEISRKNQRNILIS